MVQSSAPSFVPWTLRALKRSRTAIIETMGKAILNPSIAGRWSGFMVPKALRQNSLDAVKVATMATILRKLCKCFNRFEPLDQPPMSQYIRSKGSTRQASDRVMVWWHKSRRVVWMCVCVDGGDIMHRSYTLTRHSHPDRSHMQDNLLRHGFLADTGGCPKEELSPLDFFYKSKSPICMSMSIYAGIHTSLNEVRTSSSITQRSTSGASKLSKKCGCAESCTA